MGTGAVFMSHPTAVLRAYLAEDGPLEQGSFDLGRLSLALEILTQLKILEALPLTDLTIQLQSAFQAFLVDAGMMDKAERWYERLDAWRAPRFVAEPDADIRRDRAFGASSLAAVPEGELHRTRRLRASLGERRGPEPDYVATDELVESPSEEERTTQNE